MASSTELGISPAPALLKWIWFPQPGVSSRHCFTSKSMRPHLRKLLASNDKLERWKGVAPLWLRLRCSPERERTALAFGSLARQGTPEWCGAPPQADRL